MEAPENPTQPLEPEGVILVLVPWFHKVCFGSTRAARYAEVWETDFSGYTRTLQLDDHEAGVVTPSRGGVRLGTPGPYWLSSV